MGRWVYKKFRLGKSSIVLSIIICVLCSLFIGTCIVFENTVAVAADTSASPNGLEKIYYENYALFGIIKDISTVVLSIVGTSLILGAAFEVNNRNSAYSDFFEDDVVGSSEFYKNISKENRLKILKFLQSQEYFEDNLIIGEMYEGIRDRLKNSKYAYPKEKYYMECCKYRVTCIDKGTHFEKVTVREMQFKTYEGKLKLNELTLGRYKNIPANVADVNQFEIISLRINGELIDKSFIKIEDENEPDDVLLAQANYKLRQKFILAKSIELDEKSNTTIVFEYKSMTEKDDIHSTFRCTVPCKHFEVHFSVDDHYALIPIAFGFCDHAQTSPNSHNESEATIRFNQWLFEDDGVVIILKEKSKAEKEKNN